MSSQGEAIPGAGHEDVGDDQELDLGTNACFVQSGPVPIKSKNGDYPLT